MGTSMNLLLSKVYSHTLWYLSYYDVVKQYDSKDYKINIRESQLFAMLSKALGMPFAI